MNKFFRFLFLFLMSAVGLTSYAYDIVVDGVYYNITSVTDFTCEVTGAPRYYSGNIVIPSQIKYNNKLVNVTGIGEDAFRNCVSLTGVEIPNSVVYIGNGAFAQCRSLTIIEIPESVKNIGAEAFYYCISFKEIKLPNLISNIEAGTFTG